MNKQDGNAIEEYLKKLVEEAINKREFKIKEEEAKEIVESILPELEKMVAKTVLKHFKELNIYFQEKFKDPEEI